MNTENGTSLNKSERVRTNCTREESKSEVGEFRCQMEESGGVSRHLCTHRVDEDSPVGAPVV